MTLNRSSTRLSSLPCQITHVITGLHVGGAEAMLYKLLAAQDSQRLRAAVVALIPGGEYAERIKALTIPVYDLGMRRGVPSPPSIWRLRHLLRQTAPDVVQTWMYHADLLGSLATWRHKQAKLAWNVRHSNLEPELNRALSLWTMRLCAWLSHWAPAAIVCNSMTAKQVHVALGYAAEKFVIIPNGFDTDAYAPDPAAPHWLRRELGIPPQAALIGLVGRFHEQKDHANFFRAAALLHQAHPEAHFLLCGAGIDPTNPTLAGMVADADVTAVTHLLGPRADMPRLMAALDLLCSSSAGEGFPNVVGEAMACGVPCVVTDVGDSAIVVGDTGFVVPPRHPAALAAALAHGLELDLTARRELGLRARQRIVSEYGIQRIAAQYAELYLALTNG